jgi:hypothetical protein
MSTTADRLDTATFPEDYADILIETLAITAANYLSAKDALDHYRRLDDGQAAEVMRRIAEHEDAILPDEAPPAYPAPYFRGPSGTRYTYAEVADRIRRDAPHTLGQPIFPQLEGLGLLREFQDGTTPCSLPFTFAENLRIEKFSARHDVRLPDHVFVTIDDRFEIALIRTSDVLMIEVRPITGGEVWDNPFDRFDVDEEEIRALEREMGDD